MSTITSLVPVGVYTDATGVIDATAAAEIVALGAVFLALFPNSSTGAQGAHPDYDQVPPAWETAMRAEFAAFLAAIAAAPTS